MQGPPTVVFDFLQPAVSPGDQCRRYRLFADNVPEDLPFFVNVLFQLSVSNINTREFCSDIFVFVSYVLAVLSCYPKEMPDDL